MTFSLFGRCSLSGPLGIAVPSSSPGLYAPQADDYVTRALDPDGASSYHLAGEQDGRR